MQLAEDWFGPVSTGLQKTGCLKGGPHAQRLCPAHIWAWDEVQGPRLAASLGGLGPKHNIWARVGCLGLRRGLLVIGEVSGNCSGHGQAPSGALGLQALSGALGLQVRSVGHWRSVQATGGYWFTYHAGMWSTRNVCVPHATFGLGVGCLGSGWGLLVVGEAFRPRARVEGSPAWLGWALWWALCATFAPYTQRGTFELRLRHVGNAY
ncbi:hypothetical protein BU15DRAFT_61617 [Melanogaster broomeanus]|nr:hypothetical protein BU15DRAFT_61617 [Melanogaster broomeanus]